MKDIDVTALGELLIDFTSNGISEQGNTLFEANPGGAVANVLAMINQLGHRTEFIGKVGSDFFGLYLKETLETLGIGIQGLVLDDKEKTTLALVHTKADGDRDFSFYRNPGADIMLREDEVPVSVIERTKIFHFGTLSMTDEPVNTATKKALEYAKQANCLISFDPNLRPPLWSSLELAKEKVLFGLTYCDVLKISDNEIQWLTGIEDYDQAAAWIEKEYHIPLVLVTLGKMGSRAYFKGNVIESNAFILDNSIETTGAGDTFMGCILNYILVQAESHGENIHHIWESLTLDNIKEMLTFANAAASLITTKKGALRVMPKREEIQELINQTQLNR